MRREFDSNDNSERLVATVRDALEKPPAIAHSRRRQQGVPRPPGSGRRDRYPIA